MDTCIILADLPDTFLFVDIPNSPKHNKCSSKPFNQWYNQIAYSHNSSTHRTLQNGTHYHKQKLGHQLFQHPSHLSARISFSKRTYFTITLKYPQGNLVAAVEEVYSRLPPREAEELRSGSSCLLHNHCLST